ncbi:MAG: FKBP-type peptidyl-prolyl cis-trans isomerase [Caulobacterales bacterium]|nr:FKBP-type peptidyl-prolyl cis-trans isomerase [Caulobacterales bacterium]
MRYIALTASILALSLGACTGSPAPAPTDPGAPSQTAWEAGQHAYLDWNAAQRGWAVTESGLQFRRVGEASSSGVRPGPTDTVRVHYRGTFIDGREFDGNFGGEPIEFPLNRVIRGWTEGLQLMRAGETYDFVIPGELAYGDRWVGGDLIPPNSTLIFRVELLSVTPAA